MNTQTYIARITHPKTLAGRLRTACTTTLLPLLLLVLPSTVQAQFNYVITNGTVTITKYTGSGGDVSIPHTITGLPVTGIGDEAFYYCISLTSVTIPNSVTSIGHGAFVQCRGLTSFTIPNSVTNIGYNAFNNCISLTNVTIGNGLTSIGETAFATSGLVGVTIPSSVTDIGYGAFEFCSRLADVSIPNSVTNIEQWAFADCTDLSSVTIPNGVATIGEAAFCGCTSLTNVSIPDSVTNIEQWAFSGCTSLEAITVGVLNSFYSSLAGVLFDKSQTRLIQYPTGSDGGYIIPHSVTTIEDYAFSWSSNLTSVTIPDSATSMEDFVFNDCTCLTSVTIPDSVTNIGVMAFSDCVSLTNITLGNGLSSIGNQMFQRCTSLTSITIPDSVTRIGVEAFRACTGLTNITMGSHVSQIAGWAFQYCPNLIGMYFEGNCPTIALSELTNDTNVTVYYLPGTVGWGSMFGGRPTALWFLPNPLILTSGPGFGVQSNAFGFIISWATNLPVVVEACTNPVNHSWSPVQTNARNGGWSYFTDPQWTNYPARFYRLRSP